MKGRTRTGRIAAPMFAALVWLAPLMLVAASSVAAHDQSFSHADLDWEPAAIRATVSVHRDDAAPALGIAAAESLSSATFLAHESPRLAAYVARGLRLAADGCPLPLRFVGAEAVPGKRTITLTFVAPLARPAGRLALSASLFPSDPQHETFANVYAGGRLLRQDVLTREKPALALYGRDAAGVLAVVATFVQAGIHHIFIGPDHILFIVGLLLLGGGLARVLKVATAFTLAHSITLALAATGRLAVSGRIVEPLIALSIVYVGIENLRTRPGMPDRRTVLAFGFGLIHGLGFASVLSELGLPQEALGWSLVSFNLGVELGQACIILAVTPLLGLLRTTRPRAALKTVAASSWGIIAAGAFWFVQRVLVRG